MQGLYMLQGSLEGGILFSGWKNEVSKSPAQAAESRSEHQRGALCQVPCRPGREHSPFIQHPRVGEGASPATSYPRAPAARGAQACAGGRWASGAEGSMDPRDAPASSQDTPGRSQPRPTSHAYLLALHLVLPWGGFGPQLQNPSLRGSPAVEGPAPWHGRGDSSSRKPGSPCSHSQHTGSLLTPSQPQGGTACGAPATPTPGGRPTHSWGHSESKAARAGGAILAHPPPC